VFASYEHSSLFGITISNEGKKFYNTLTPGVNVLKLFFVVIDEEENKLGRLSPASHSSLV
jgi:hypothetical protein